MTIHKMDTRSNPEKIPNNDEVDNTPTEEKTDLKNQNNTIKKIPNTNLEATDSEQTYINERDVKSISIINKLYSILKLCVETVVLVFSYIFDKIDSFFIYILSKFMTQAKATKIIPPNDSDSIIAETSHEDNESPVDNKEAKITEVIPLNDSDSIIAETSHENSESPVDNKEAKITEVIPLNDSDFIIAEASHENSELPEYNKEAKATTDTEIQDLLTSKDKLKDENPVIENQPIVSKEFFAYEAPQNKEDFQDSQPSKESEADVRITDNTLPSNTAYDPIQEDLAATKEDNNKKTPQKGLLGSLKSRLRRTLKLEQKLLDQSFHNFFKKYSKSACDIDTLTKMSSCSQEDFNKMFIDKSIYYFKKNSRKEPTPSDLLTFINNTIIFINTVIDTTSGTDKIQAIKCKNMMQKALGHYIELQINAGANDTRSFTSNDALFYMRDFANEHLQKVACSKKTADHAFLIDIVRDDPKIEFFESNELVWNSSNLESAALTKKLRKSDLELKDIGQDTKEYTDKFSELEEIEAEIIQYRRSQIQKFLNKDDPEATNFMLKEQSQAAVAAPTTLIMPYVKEKLDDAFGQYKAPNVALNSDRKFNLEFYKTKENKIIIKTTLSGTLNCITDDLEFNNLCPYKVTTEVEYDFKNSDNNRIIAGQINFFKTV